MDKKGWILITAITAALISIFFAQNKKIEILRLQIDESNQELKKIKDEIGTANSEMEAKKKELLKITYHLELERKAYAEKSKLLSEELKQADSTVFANETLLFGGRAPVVDSSVPTDILSTITELFEAMEKNDEAKFAELDKKGVLASFYKKRDKVDKILWIQNDPDHRAEAVKEWLEVKTELKLLKVFYFMKDGSIIDPNYAMVQENGKWVILSVD